MPAKLSAKHAAFKFRRAGVHLNELDRRLRAFYKRHPYTTVRDHKPGLEYVQFNFPHAADPPLSVGAVLGDFLQNLRGSLNCLVYELTLLHPDVTMEILASAEFPIFAEDKPSAIESRISHIPEDAKDTIKAMQPHKRGDAAKAEDLWILHEMSTLDRHCLIPIAGHQIRMGVPGRPDAWATASGLLQHGEMMMRIPIGQEEELRAKFAGRVVYSASTTLPLWIGIDGLKRMHHMVGSEILPQFNRFFPKPPKGPRVS